MVLKTKRLKLKGPKEGYCAICQNYKKLTYDHIPPKGCVLVTPVEIRTLTQGFYEKNVEHTISQNGVKFRTLCKKCNNEKLGLNYDPELKRFSDEVSLFLKAKINTGLHLPPQQIFKIKPQKIIRAIVGHTLAAFVPEDMSKPNNSSPFYEALREYFLDEALPIPEKLEIYVWIYPVKDQVHVRGFGVLSTMGRGTTVGDLLKFFPLSFWLVWDKPEGVSIPQEQLGVRKNLLIGEEENITINFKNIPQHDWPEQPDSNGVIMLDDQYSSYSKAKKK